MKGMKYKCGDVLGLLVNCRANPMLALYKNGLKVHEVEIDEEAYGRVWCPVGSVYMDGDGRGVLRFERNPALPPL